MTAVQKASFIQANAHPARTDRRFLHSLAGRGGVIPKTPTFTDLKVSQRAAGANMSVDVAEGQCYITGTESAYQGLYHCDNQGIHNVGLTASNPTNARRDLIVARIHDVEYGVAVINEFTIEAIAGTPAGTPVDPTVPDNCIVLARVQVAANATSITNANITDLRNNYAAVTGSALIGNQQKALSAGSVLPCLSTARPTIGLYEGMVIYETDTKVNWVYTGSVWTWFGTRGLIGYGESTVDQIGIQTSDVDLTNVAISTITIPAGRNILLEANVKLLKNGPDTTTGVSVTLAKSDNTVYAIRDTYVVAPSYETIYANTVLRGTVSGSIAFKTRLRTAAGFVNALANSHMAAYDMGPT